MAKDNELVPYQLNLTGRLIQSVDATQLAFVDNANVPVVNGFTELKNIKYTDNGIRGVAGGMTKVNTTALTSHPKIRNMHYFKKIEPAETHLLVHAKNTAETEAKVFENKTTIGSQGDFEATALHTDASGAGKGRFSSAPDEHICYCNGVETMVYGGDEARIASFAITDSGNTFEYDYTEKVQNTLTDANNVATVYPATAGASPLALYHLDTDFTDATGNHNATAIGNAQISTAKAKFGAGSALFDGTGDWLTIPDHADFDLSGGVWTIDMWVNIGSGTIGTAQGLYSQGTPGSDNDYIAITLTDLGALQLSIYAAGVEVVNLTTAIFVLLPYFDTFAHIEVCSGPGASNTDYRIFVNGVQKAFVNDAQKPADYGGLVYIGARNKGDTTDIPLTGNLDEIRVVKETSHTADFVPNTTAYDVAGAVTSSIRIGNTMPLSGFKLTIGTANTDTSTMSVFYWSGSSWAPVTNFVDGTASGGITLATTGTVTFDSTESVVKQTVINQSIGYYYLATISSVSTGTTISNATVKVPFQPIQDMWNGELRTINSCMLFEDSINKDNTINVVKDEFTWDSTTNGNIATYMTMTSLAAGTEYLMVGFVERQQGINCKIIPNGGNTTAGTIVAVDYWDGDEWVSVGIVNDGTIENDISFVKSGFITWTPLAENVEFKREVNNELPLYYYKLSWSKAFSTGRDGNGVLCYYIGGIPVQRLLDTYRFSLHAQNRLWLFSNQTNDKKEAIVSDAGTLNVFNGKGVGDPFRFGASDGPVAAIELFTRNTTNTTSLVFVLTDNSAHVVQGDNPENWEIVNLPGGIGCNAPYTLAVSTLGLEFAPLQRKQVAIWQGSSGIYMFDNSAILPISGDISNYFDQSQSDSINLSKSSESFGWFEIENGEHHYHWAFASGSSTTLDKEMVFDLKRQKWFEFDRGATKRLQGGGMANDTNNNTYNYGFEDNGYLQQLNSGTDFDGVAISYHLETGDILPADDINILTILDILRLVTVSKTTTTNPIKVEHFGDTATAATVDNTNNNAFYNFTTKRTGYRVAMPSLKINTPPHVFHRLKFTISTNDESGNGFEPLYIGGFFKKARLNKLSLTD